MATLQAVLGLLHEYQAELEKLDTMVRAGSGTSSSAAGSGSLAAPLAQPDDGAQQFAADLTAVQNRVAAFERSLKRSVRLAVTDDLYIQLQSERKQFAVRTLQVQVLQLLRQLSWLKVSASAHSQAGQRSEIISLRKTMSACKAKLVKAVVELKRWLAAPGSVGPLPWSVTGLNAEDMARALTCPWSPRSPEAQDSTEVQKAAMLLEVCSRINEERLHLQREAQDALQFFAYYEGACRTRLQHLEQVIERLEALGEGTVSDADTSVLSLCAAAGLTVKCKSPVAALAVAHGMIHCLRQHEDRFKHLHVEAGEKWKPILLGAAAVVASEELESETEGPEWEYEEEEVQSDVEVDTTHELHDFVD